MFDIDYFKKINDTYGHDAGDEVLKAISKKISSIIRQEDLIGRIGGEEFVIVLKNCTKETLHKIAQKIRQEIEKLVVTTNNNTIKATISIGASPLRKDDTLDTILKRIDDLLYKAKENGRNRVEIS